MKKDNTLKPCPFCGADAEIEHYSNEFLGFIHYARVKCQKCGAKGPAFQQALGYSADEKAADAWNGRKMPQVAYICDQKKETCRGGTPSCRIKNDEYDACEYTTDITHAAHFVHYGSGTWFEMKEEERV